MSHASPSECPDDSILRRLGPGDEPDERADDASDAADEAIERHIESCSDCQQRLEEMAAGARRELSSLLDSESPLWPDWPQSSPQDPVLADFRILQELGRGERSRVYLAEELSTARMVALKLIPVASDNSTAQRAQWLAEVRAAARVEHQNVVRLYRVDEAADFFLLVFEYVAGGTLRDWQRTPASQLQIAAVTQIIARAVHQIHQRNILHLDLKPSNILIDISEGTSWDTFVPKVSDFGIASGPHSPVQIGSRSTVIRGTPAYMAPEQALGDPSRLTAATDVYGLGGILYCLLTGRPPVAETTDGPTLEHMLLSEITPPHLLDHTLDRHLSDIVMRCLRKHPSDRFVTPLELANTLQAWMAPYTATAPHAPTQRISALSAASANPVAGNESVEAQGASLLRRRPRPAVTRTLLFIAGCVPVLLFVRGLTVPANDNSKPADDLPDRRVSQIATAGPLPVTLSEMLNRRIYQSADPIDVAHLVRELSELPPAFSIDRAATLVIASRRFTDSLLAQKDTPIDECLRFGVLQYTSASRFQESGLHDLYSAARYLLADSGRLLEYVVLQRPDDQAALQKLIASRTLVASLRVEAEQKTAESVKTHLLDRSESLRPVVNLINRLQDQRQRIFWAGYVLDTHRLQYWYSVFSGDAESAAMFAAWESEAWTKMKEDQSTPDLMFRHAMMEAGSSARHAPKVISEQWILQEHQSMLQRESVYIDLASQFFSVAADGAEATPLEWDAILQRTAAGIQQAGLEETLLPRVIHEDLIRPLTTFSTRHRIENHLHKAERLQRSYLALCEAAMRAFPGNSEVHLAFSEAWLQSWKNALRRDQTDAAVAALQRSLEEAQLAVNASPTCLRARDQVADRMKRLARIQISLPNGSVNR